MRTERIRSWLYFENFLPLLISAYRSRWVDFIITYIKNEQENYITLFASWSTKIELHSRKGHEICYENWNEFETILSRFSKVPRFSHVSSLLTNTQMLLVRINYWSLIIYIGIFFWRYINDKLRSSKKSFVLREMRRFVVTLSPALSAVFCYTREHTRIWQTNRKNRTKK